MGRGEKAGKSEILTYSLNDFLAHNQYRKLRKHIHPKNWASVQ